MQRTLGFVAIVFLGILLSLCACFNLVPSGLAKVPPANSLATGDSAPLSCAIPINSPIELDNLTKNEVYDIRESFVARHRELLEGDYHPAEAVFGQIIDGKPWWGIEGQFCGGKRRRSVDGVSEEARFILNPFLLLAIEENHSWNVEADCSPSYPKPISLEWFARYHKAKVTYAMSVFYNKRRRNRFPAFAVEGSSLYLKNLNARDFGYEFVYLSPVDSRNIKRINNAQMFVDSVQLRSFLHCGGSCGQPGGCNNGSPTESDLYFNVNRLPATLYCKLWKNKPPSLESEADFIFIIELE